MSEPRQKFEPQEPGYYWIVSDRPNTSVQHICHFESGQIMLAGEDFRRPWTWVWKNNLIFLPGPLTPPTTETDQ